MPLPAAYGDKRLITEVFQNLLSNAIKFTRDIRPAAIEVGHNPDTSEDIYFVRDNGVGFDMDHARNSSERSSVFTGPMNSREPGSASLPFNALSSPWRPGLGGGKAQGGATFYFSLPAREQRRAS